MKNKLAGLIVGGLITATTLGVAFGVNSIGNAAAAKTEQASVSSGMNNGQMSPDMMNSPEMQKECLNMMVSPEMQKTMKGMMEQPQMQNMMKQLMVSDPEFKQLMSDIVNNAGAVAIDQAPPTEHTMPIDHNVHHNQ